MRESISSYEIACRSQQNSLWTGRHTGRQPNNSQLIEPCLSRLAQAATNDETDFECGFCPDRYGTKLMATHQPYSVVLSYAEDRLIVQAVEQPKPAALASGQLQMPIFLDEFGYNLDDEFARRLGVAMLNLLALGIPDLKRHMHVTQAGTNA